MYTKIYKGKEARQLILDGAKELYDAVTATYGPTSGNVGVLRDLRGLDVTHDGVTVAKSIELKGPKRAGAEIIKNTAIKMDKELGDGTSTVVILAFSIIEAVQDTLLLGESPIKIRDRLQTEAELVLKKLGELTRPGVTLEILNQVASISASDNELGVKIAGVIHEIGLDGSVSIENGLSTTVETELTQGYVVENGVATNYMLADPETMTTTLIDPEILLLDKKIDDLEVIADVLKGVKKGPLLIIANDFSDPVIRTLVKWNQDKITNVVFVKSPRFADKRTKVLEDIAAFVGTEVADKTVKLGHADKVVVGVDDTTIYSGHGDVTERSDLLKKQIKSTTDEFEKSELEKRLASLTGKAAVIKVGANSQDEADEIRYRIDDAVSACRAALRGGVVAGGGTTPLDLATHLPGDSILKRVLGKPFKILLENVGLSDDDFVVGDGKGVNVRTGEAVDLFKEGIIEPAETIKKAIESAVSIAGTAITMKVLVVEEEENNE
jgi:chaperonin GroEL